VSSDSSFGIRYSGKEDIRCPGLETLIDYELL
jgi:hypothetical protein